MKRRERMSEKGARMWNTARANEEMRERETNVYNDVPMLPPKGAPRIVMGSPLRRAEDEPILRYLNFLLGGATSLPAAEEKGGLSLGLVLAALQEHDTNCLYLPTAISASGSEAMNCTKYTEPSSK